MNNHTMIDRELLKPKLTALNDIHRVFNELIPSIQNIEGTEISKNREFSHKKQQLLSQQLEQLRQKNDLHYCALRISDTSIYLTFSKRFTHDDYIHYVCKDFFFGQVVDNKVSITQLSEQQLVDIDNAIAAYDEVEKKIRDLKCKYGIMFDEENIE